VKVLLDVNVLADLFLKREEWLTDAVAIREAGIDLPPRMEPVFATGDADAGPVAGLVVDESGHRPLGTTWHERPPE